MKSEHKELDILLVAVPSPNPMIYYTFDKQGMPPLGLGYLATVLKRENYSVKVVDMAVPQVTVDFLLQQLKSSKPKLVGLSCTTETYLVAIRLSYIIKSLFGDCIVIIGGPHVSFEYESALSNKSIDYVVINEGENSLKNLCGYCIRGIGNKKELKGIAFRENGDIVCTEPESFILNLDLLPIPDRSIFENLSIYPIPTTILSSRGCPGKCIFCAAGALSGGRYRFRSAESILEEVEYLKSLGFDRVSFIDDTMTANLSRLNQFLDNLTERGIKISWYCESRVDNISRDVLHKMKAAGLTNIQFGVESGSQGVLDSIKKNISLQQIHDAFRWCKELGILASTNMIIGQPADDESTIQDTLRVASEIASLGGAISFSICTPFPGTPIWQNPKEYGLEIVNHDLDRYNLFCPVFNTKKLTATEIRNAYFRAVTSFVKSV